MFLITKSFSVKAPLSQGIASVSATLMITEIFQLAEIK